MRSSGFLILLDQQIFILLIQQDFFYGIRSTQMGLAYFVYAFVQNLYQLPGDFFLSRKNKALFLLYLKGMFPGIGKLFQSFSTVKGRRNLCCKF